MATKMQSNEEKQDHAFTVQIDHPTEEQIAALFPKLAQLKVDLEALWCKVRLNVVSVHFEVVEMKEHD